MDSIRIPIQPAIMPPVMPPRIDIDANRSRIPNPGLNMRAGTVSKGAPISAPTRPQVSTDGSRSTHSLARRAHPVTPSRQGQRPRFSQLESR